MASKEPLPPPEIDDLLSDDENEDDQEYVVVGPDKVRIPKWHLELLREREARYEREGMVGTPWEEVEKELLEELTKRAT
ncbi:MAG TPA: hypothetical protein VF290_08120 [Pyrinomonadaceae bacterium]